MIEVRHWWWSNKFLMCKMMMYVYTEHSCCFWSSQITTAKQVQIECHKELTLKNKERKIFTQKKNGTKSKSDLNVVMMIMEEMDGKKKKRRVKSNNNSFILRANQISLIMQWKFKLPTNLRFTLLLFGFQLWFKSGNWCAYSREKKDEFSSIIIRWPIELLHRK